MAPSPQRDPRRVPHRDPGGPWLVAAWPGMGSVARIAADYLAERLHASEVAEIPPERHFEVESVLVRHGLLRKAELPRSRFYRWRHPARVPGSPAPGARSAAAMGGPGLDGQRDLLFFLGDRQPGQGGFAFCEELLGIAEGLGVSRVVTFAALATPVHPLAEPRVLAVANDVGLLDELVGKDVPLLADGQIGGLNGVLLAAAAERDLPGMCLLGELPFFASSLPNPKAAAAILRTFAGLAHVEVDLEPLLQHAKLAERSMVELMTQMQRAAGIEIAAPLESAAEEEAGEPQEARAEELPPEVSARIERLFQQARTDRSKALELKALLDRHDVFRRYEDRFLDLFKEAE